MKYVLWTDNEHKYELGIIQAGVFQAYQYPELGITTPADWKHLVRAHLDKDLNKYRHPGKVLDPNNGPVSMEEMFALLDHAVMIPAVK
jgi:hypothetical protein